MIAQAVANIGVPTALCFYVLFTLNKTVNKLTDKVGQLIEYIKTLENDIRALRRD